jgi:2-octaprenyl-6-methoxyphenol hydroxylase
MATDEFVFLIELERRFGHRLGELALEGPRAAFPLGLTLARDFVRERFALLGDAAHGIHPIAGQGLNLAFRDAAALAETIVDAARLGLDVGSLEVLRRYETWRRYDTWQMGVTTDLLNRLFSNDIAPLRGLRDLGLGIVDRLPKLKAMFIDEAAGLSGAALPKLLRGEAL